MTILAYSSSATAYGHCQWDETINRTADVLMIQSEGVIGLPDTWPVAVTKEPGEFHMMVPEWVNNIIEENGWTSEQIREAIDLAVQYGFELADWAKDYK